MKIEEEPLFHIDEVNPTLYNAVQSLNEVKILRIQLQHLKGFILTCKNDVAEDFRKRLWPREYLCDDIHQYSALDLVQVHTGQLTNHLRKIISFFTKHVYKCTLCSQKGFICELCSSDKIIYPFEVLTTVQCHRCQSVYHKKCRKDRSCSKCLRLQFRRKNQEENMEV
ncbi:pleckstrin homology domain-containing family M member 3-like [Rhopilema esculentum]|uniref:pleckstrin homology domain-containing family M member 3-like n=1 Tax=Rhopilema esculentum TaxID=499914 RepID=UPI0031DACA1B